MCEVLAQNTPQIFIGWAKTCCCLCVCPFKCKWAAARCTEGGASRAPVVALITSDKYWEFQELLAFYFQTGVKQRWRDSRRSDNM